MSKFSEKVKVFINPPAGFNDPPKPAPDDLREKFALAGWSDDPGTGIAVLLPDGRELLNPVPMAPPIGYKPEVSMMDQIQRQVAQHLKMLSDGVVVDDAKDVEDFDVEEEFDPFSYYEIVDMQPDAPVLPAAKPPEIPAVPESIPTPPAVIAADPPKS